MLGKDLKHLRAGISRSILSASAQERGTWAVLFHLVSWRLAPQGVGQGDNTEDHLLPEVSSVCRPTRKILYLLLWVLLSPCVLKKQSYRLKTPILHIKLDIFSPNVNLYLIVSLSLTLWL